VSEGSPEYYQEFIQLFPDDPLCVRIRWLLANLLEAAAWHKAVMLNSPLAYKAFYESHVNSPYAQAALHLQSQPKILRLTQASHLILPQHPIPTITPLNKIEGELHPLTGKIVTLPVQKTNTPIEVIKNNGPTNHVTELPPIKPQLHTVRHEDAAVKFKPEPTPVNRFHGNTRLARPIGRNTAHFAAFGGGRRGSMR